MTFYNNIIIIYFVWSSGLRLQYLNLDLPCYTTAIIASKDMYSISFREMI